VLDVKITPSSKKKRQSKVRVARRRSNFRVGVVARPRRSVVTQLYDNGTIAGWNRAGKCLTVAGREVALQFSQERLTDGQTDLSQPLFISRTEDWAKDQRNAQRDLSATENKTSVLSSTRNIGGSVVGGENLTAVGRDSDRPATITTTTTRCRKSGLRERGSIASTGTFTRGGEQGRSRRRLLFHFSAACNRHHDRERTSGQFSGYVANIRARGGWPDGAAT